VVLDAQEGTNCAASREVRYTPQETFIKDFPPNLLNLKWWKEVASGKPCGRTSWRATFRQSRNCSTVGRVAVVVVPLLHLKDINKRMNEGESNPRDAKKEMIEANLRLVISLKVHEPAACSSST
jgi:RNA polymerase primary sigma factor